VITDKLSPETSISSLKKANQDLRQGGEIIQLCSRLLVLDLLRGREVPDTVLRINSRKLTFVGAGYTKNCPAASALNQVEPTAQLFSPYFLFSPANSGDKINFPSIQLSMIHHILAWIKVRSRHSCLCMADTTSSATSRGNLVPKARTKLLILGFVIGTHWRNE
jgi:hypothetical protein